MSAEILVVVEHLQGKVTDATHEALGAARAIAAGAEVVAVLGGAANTGLAAELAADRVLHVADVRLDAYSPDAYESAMRSIVAARSPRLVIVANTTVGMDLAAGLAALLGLPLAAYCVGLRADGTTLVATCQIYGGKVIAEVGLDGPAIVSIVPGSFVASHGDGSAVVETVAAPQITTRLRLVAYEVAPSADVDITKESVLVSVGRGIGGPENVPLAEELAAALGGVVSASRPVTDSGWLPKSRQVGKSGLTVRPKLYLAIGISGAPEHLQGMKDSELIVAINTDPGAPIFDVAHFGAVADVIELVPALTERLLG